MSRRIIDLGVGPHPPNPPSEDDWFDAFGKCNGNFDDLYASMARTPRNSGITVDPTGSADSTTGLNQFFALLASSGDPGFLPAGEYRTTAELLLPAGAMYLRGAGRAMTVIRPGANSYHGLRAVGSFEAWHHGRHIGGFSIRGPNATPAKNGKAALVLDNSPQTVVEDVLVDGFDIGLDGINNNYNSTFRGLLTDRTFSNVNCAVNIREGAQSGSDWIFYDLQVAGRRTAVCIAGNGGGYRFFGASCGTNGVAPNDNYGIFTFGRDYASDAEFPGIGSMLLSSIHMEGWRNTWAIRAYGSVSFTVQGTGFNPSAPESGQQALGIYRHTSAVQSASTWLGNDVGMGYFANAAICNIAGENDDFQMVEFGWQSSPMTSVGGSSRPRSWVKTLLDQSNVEARYRRGIGFYSDNANGGLPVLMLGSMRLRPNPNDGTWLQSTDGTNFQAFGRPMLVSDGGANRNIETWHIPARIAMTSGSANTVTARPSSAANCPIGTRVEVVQRGTGQTTLVAGAGVTIHSRAGLRLAGRHAVAWLQYEGGDVWQAGGDLVA